MPDVGDAGDDALNDSSQHQIAIAALFAALVETLDEKTEGFAQAFLAHLNEKQARLKESGDAGDSLAPLAWTKALLQEDVDRAAPASVVYAKDWSREQEDEHLPASDKVQLATLDEALRFWSRLPTYDREKATIETASGHRLELDAITRLIERRKDVWSR